MRSGSSLPRIETPSECTLLLRFGDHIDASCNDRVHAAARALATPAIAGLLELVPAYATLAVHYDPMSWRDVSVRRSATDTFVGAITDRLSSINGEAWTDQFRIVDIPVCYDREFGLDLSDAANELGLSVEDLIELHCAGSYRVAMLGFAPGFPYLLGLDSRLNRVARWLAADRTHAAATVRRGAPPAAVA